MLEDALKRIIDSGEFRELAALHQRNTVATVLVRKKLLVLTEEMFYLGKGFHRIGPLVEFDRVAMSVCVYVRGIA